MKYGERNNKRKLFRKALTEMRYLFFNQKDEMIGITSKPNKVTKK